jgi:Predicted hydrolases or acyltransferases (alpha/beta hydrolase superfamily)
VVPCRSYCSARGGAVQPKTRYAKSGDGKIAYQVLGEGPLDVIFIPGFVSNVEFYWELPTTTRIFERLASFSRVVVWDKRGTGLSDPSTTSRRSTNASTT